MPASLRFFAIISSIVFSGTLADESPTGLVLIQMGARPASTDAADIEEKDSTDDFVASSDDAENEVEGSETQTAVADDVSADASAAAEGDAEAGADAEDGDSDHMASALLSRSLNEKVEAQEASNLDGTAEPKRGVGWHYNAAPMGASTATSVKKGQYPQTIWPTPNQVFDESLNGTKPIDVEAGTELYEKLVRVAQVIQTIAYLDKNNENATQEMKKDALARFSRATAFLERLETKQTMSGVAVVDLVAMALRNQSAESMLENKALLTASDMSKFVAGFRGEDFGTHFNHDAKARFLVSVQGDIVGSDHEFAGIEDTFNRAPGKIWPKGHVKYCYANDTTTRVKQVFEAAVQHYQTLAPFLSFEEVDLVSNTGSADTWDAHECAAEHAIIVTSDPKMGCFSSLGMHQEVTQQINLQDPSCALVGFALHQIGHALGMAHEHPRSEEDYSNDPNATGYVKRHRVFKGRKDYFSVDDSPLRLETYMLGEKEVKTMARKLHGGNLSALAFSSDPLSIMHYDALAFVGIYYRDHRMSVFQEPDFERMGQRMGLSQFDVRHLVRLYGGATGMSEMPPVGDVGCIDGYDGDAIARGKGVCSSLEFVLPWCSANAMTHCCRCGGGVHYQCSAGQDCSKFALNKRAYYWREQLFGVCLVLLLFVAAYVWSRLPPLSRKLIRFDQIPEDAVDNLNDLKDQPGSSGEGRPRGAMAHARDRASGALKVLADWIQTNAAPGNYTEKEHQPGQHRLPQESIERFNKSFAPFAGGFSSGRNAPAAPLIGGEDSVQKPRSMGEDPANIKKVNKGPYYRMHNSDSSDQEHGEGSDPFEKPIDHPATIEETTSDEDAPASKRDDDERDEGN